MAEAYIGLLRAFNFDEMEAWIAIFSAFLFTANLLGGLLSALTFVHSNQFLQRILWERISFRLFILAEVLLWVFVFFYHVFMIEGMSISHLVYWISATLMMPLFAIIASQLVLVTFSSKVKAKAVEYNRRQKIIRKKRRQEMDGAAKPSKLAQHAQQMREIKKLRAKLV